MLAGVKQDTLHWLEISNMLPTVIPNMTLKKSLVALKLLWNVPNLRLTYQEDTINLFALPLLEHETEDFII